MTAITTGRLRADDGLNLHTACWLPDGDPRGVVVIVHGIGEHGARYDHVGRFLAGAGWAVYTHDHRNHGQSDLAKNTTIAHFAADLHTHIQAIKAAHPGAKVFVYGHSMGALISLVYMLDHQADVDGWISTGTPLNLDETLPSVLVKIAGTLQKVIPWLPFSKLDVTDISRAPDVVAAYESDPLVHHGRVPVGLGADLVLQGIGARARLAEITLPLLVLHGSADAITPPSGSHTLCERAGSTDKTLKIYDGLYHEIHNEPEQQTVLDDIAAWLDERA